MPAWTNNYTAPEPTIPLVANPRYFTEERKVTASIVIGGVRRIELNSRIHKLLDEYSLLENNWDDDGAIAPDNEVIQKAQNLTLLMERHGQGIFHCAPGPNGEIMLDIRNNIKSKSIEIILYSDHSVVVLFPEEGRPTQKDFYIDQLPVYLNWLNQK